MIGGPTAACLDPRGLGGVLQAPVFFPSDSPVGRVDRTLTPIWRRGRKSAENRDRPTHPDDVESGFHGHANSPGAKNKSVTRFANT